MSGNAYHRGYLAARRGIDDCPYEGHTDASMYLQMRWRAGHFDGLTAPRKYVRSDRKVTRRRDSVARHVRSPYAIKRILEAKAQ